MMSLNQTSVKQKADSFFYIYLMMGEDRSLTKLHEILTNTGLTITLASLKHYSTHYDWQLRLEETTAHLQAHTTTERAASTIIKMNDSQAKLGTAFQALARQNIIKNLIPNFTTLTPRDTAYLADVGVKLERLARGEATTRQEVVNSLVSPMVFNIINLYQQVNMIDDVERRQQEFALGCQAILEQTVGPTDEQPI